MTWEKSDLGKVGFRKSQTWEKSDLGKVEIGKSLMCEVVMVVCEEENEEVVVVSRCNSVVVVSCYGVL